MLSKRDCDHGPTSRKLPLSSKVLRTCSGEWISSSSLRVACLGASSHTSPAFPASINSATSRDLVTVSDLPSTT